MISCRNVLLDTFANEGSKCTSTVSTINKDNMGDVLDFDETVTMYNRSSYLNYLIGNEQVERTLTTETTETSVMLWQCSPRTLIFICRSRASLRRTVLAPLLVTLSPPRTESSQSTQRAPRPPRKLLLH